MNDYKARLEIGQKVSFDVHGDTFHVITATSPVYIQFNDGSIITRTQGVGGTTEQFTKVTLYSEVAQDVVMSLGKGSVFDSRSNISGVNIQTSIEVANVNKSKPLLAVAPGTTVLVSAADATRKELRIGVKSDNLDGIFFGDNTTTSGNEGAWIEVGGVEYITTEGAVHAYNPHPTETITLNVLEVKRVES